MEGTWCQRKILVPHIYWIDDLSHLYCGCAPSPSKIPLDSSENLGLIVKWEIFSNILLKLVVPSLSWLKRKSKGRIQDQIFL